MKIYEDYTSLEEHEPWCGAKVAYDEIIKNDLAVEFMEYLEELYPNGLTATELNDILWFEDELIEEFLEMYEV